MSHRAIGWLEILEVGDTGGERFAYWRDDPGVVETLRQAKGRNFYDTPWPSGKEWEILCELEFWARVR
jgi:hypothetical protein